MKKNIVRDNVDKVTSIKQGINILLYLTESNKIYYQICKSSKNLPEFVKAFNKSKKISYVHKNTFYVKDIDKQTNEEWDIACANLTKINKKDIHEYLHLLMS